ncbi:hypothetical protein PAUR_a0186 [Pseudoalteromonas aurantia 208]|uniref:Orphan protein n=1 Tax=Pseudoalteromonas aurantia 208 TaxID=1314867 RepID=A0ABR9E7Z8_9GAMM|nr:hypothetical protein [Pseudoalteromonas aurantia 208]
MPTFLFPLLINLQISHYCLLPTSTARKAKSAYALTLNLMRLLCLKM